LADNTVENPPIDSKKITFIKKNIGLVDNESHITMDSWMNMYCSKFDGKGILQMDIESSEYSAILSMSIHNMLKFKYIIVEFHDLNHLKNSIGYNIIYSTFTKILAHYNIVHIHPNNSSLPVSIYEYQVPPVMEFTFMNKSFVIQEKESNSFPHELDAKNITHLEDVVLPNCWCQIPNKS
jgi:hypothetical protein